MPLRLSDLTRRERTVAVRFEGVDAALSVTYRPDRWTPAAQARWLDLFADQRGGAALAVYVATRVVTWDLADEAGTPIPLTEEALAGVDIAVLDRVVTAIIQDMRPGADDPKS